MRVGRLSVRFTCLAVVLLASLAGCAAGQEARPRNFTAAPGETAAGPQLQADAWATILALERLEPADCDERTLTDTKILKLPENPVVDDQGRLLEGEWTELWTLDRCGTIVSYTLQFLPDGRGGTFVGVQIED